MRGIREGDAEYSQFVVNEIIGVSKTSHCFIKLLLFHLYNMERYRFVSPLPLIVSAHEKDLLVFKIFHI